MTLLDDLVPTYDVASRHTIRVAASPAHVYQAARHTDLGGLWLVRVLMGLRMVPAWTAIALRRRRPAKKQPAGEQRSVGAAETRVRCADPATRQQFLRYWRVIRLGSDLIRGSMLRRIRNTAERRVV